MKKTLWVISKYANAPNEKLGTSRVFQYAQKFAQMGYEVKLISSRSNGARTSKVPGLFTSQQMGQMEYVQLNGPLINLGFSIKRILSWFIFEWNLRRFFHRQNDKPDVVLVSSLSLLTALNGIYLKKKFNVRFILEIRDIWPLSLVELSSLKMSNPLVKILGWVEKRAYKNADHIVGSMPNLKAHVGEIIGNIEKVSFVPMAFNPEFYKYQEKLPESMQNKIPKDQFIVGYAGTIGNANAMETLLESISYLNDTDIYICILGDGPLKETYEQKYASDQLIFLGKTEKEKVQDFLSHCDLLVNTWHPSKLYRYGVSPNKWIDYMYARKPIIVAYDGFQSIINEAGCGEFIEAENPKLLAEKIKAYSKKSKEELEEIGFRGKRYLEDHLSLDILAEKYSELFEETIMDK